MVGDFATRLVDRSLYQTALCLVQAALASDPNWPSQEITEAVSDLARFGHAGEVIVLLRTPPCRGNLDLHTSILRHLPVADTELWDGFERTVLANLAECARTWAPADVIAMTEGLIGRNSSQTAVKIVEATLLSNTQWTPQQAFAVLSALVKSNLIDDAARVVNEKLEHAKTLLWFGVALTFQSGERMQSHVCSKLEQRLASISAGDRGYIMREVQKLLEAKSCVSEAVIVQVLDRVSFAYDRWKPEIRKEFMNAAMALAAKKEVGLSPIANGCLAGLVALPVSAILEVAAMELTGGKGLFGLLPLVRWGLVLGAGIGAYQWMMRSRSKRAGPEFDRLQAEEAERWSFGGLLFRNRLPD